MVKVVLIGAGNVATYFCRAFLKCPNATIVQGYNRSETSLYKAHNIPFTTQLEKLVLADCYVLAIKDDGIASLSTILPFENRLVVHTSGSAPMQLLSSKQRRGVFYPLQTFSKTTKIAFEAVPLCIESEHERDLDLLEQMAKGIGNTTYRISSKQRNALHIAAVFASNFSNLMYTEAKKICDDNQLPFALLQPLIAQTAAKIKTMPPKAAQTGPAIRNDQQTIERHLDTLTNGHQKKLYQTLTQIIQQYHGKEL